MKFLLVFCLLQCTFWAQAQNEESYIADYMTKWNNSEKYLLDVVNAMPAEKINYKPTEEAKSFHDICLHIVSNMVWLSTDYLEGGKFDSDYKNRDLSKEQLIDLLQKAFEFSSNAVQNYPKDSLYTENDFFSGPMNTMQILRLMNDHLSHHRGQLTLHLRLNEIAIPKYVGW